MFKIKQIMKTANEATADVLEEQRSESEIQVNHLIYAQQCLLQKEWSPEKPPCVR
jgi:hypothetical protein